MTKNSPFILASGSPRRLALLKQVGLVPSDVIAADIDETPAKNELPAQYTKRMALEKATRVSTAHASATILAADTVVACGRRILPKAENEAQARLCLKLLSGKRHRVYTAITIFYEGKFRNRIVMSAVQFARLSKADVEAYIASNEWHGKAGGYAIQGLAERFVVRVNGSYSNIVGLPLNETCTLLESAGVCAW